MTQHALLIALCATSVTAQDAAELAPADTQTFIQVNDLATLRSEPLFVLLRQQLDRNPHVSRAWQQLAASLGLTPDEMLDRYFGRKLVMIDGPSTRHTHGVIASLVSRQDMRLAIDKMPLHKSEPSHGFDLYTTPDGHARIAYDGQWMVLGSPQAAQEMDHVLQAMRDPAAAKLAQEADFKKWSSGFEAQNQAFFYTRGSDGEFHAAVANKRGDDWLADYTGTAPPFARVVASLGKAQALDFGPLSEHVAAAVTLNLGHFRSSRNFAATADGLISPKSLADDVLPHLQAPLLAFISRIPAAEVSPPPRSDVGALGFAVKLKTTTVALDLTRIIDGLVAGFNLGIVNDADASVPIKTVEAEGYTYKTADFGAYVAARADKPALAGLFQLTYGSMGDWYVVGTHESLFKQCLAVHRSSEKGLLQTADVQTLSLVESPRPVMTLVVRGPMLSKLMESGFDAVRDHMPQVADAPPLRFLSVAKNVLAQSRGLTLQLEASDESTALKARIRLLGTLKP